MKYVRTYNTQLEKIKGWPTSDRRGAIDIIDKHNGYAFTIQFGKTPKISVYKLENPEIDSNWGDRIHYKRITNKPTKQEVKEAFKQYLNELSNL